MWIYEKRLQYPVKIKTPNQSLQKLSLVNMVVLTGSWALHCVI